MTPRLRLYALAFGTIVATAFVQGVAAHEAETGPNGGALIDVDEHHIEFIWSAPKLTFFVMDPKNAPVSTAGAKMKAIAQNNGKTTQIELDAVEPNKLTGTTDVALSPKAKIVLTGKLADGKTLQGRFMVP